MNREIKFRGYDYLDQEWYYGNIILLKGDYKDTLMYSDIRAVIIDDMGCTKIVDRETIGQYTGLKDNNGVEIYEGDLLKYSEDTSEINGIDEVFYNEQYGTFDVAINRNRHFTEVLGIYLSRLGIGTKYEVIGNIYESEVVNE